MGGPSRQAVLVYRWSLYTGGPYTQVVLVYRWSLYTGGRCIQVVVVYRWSLYRGGPCSYTGGLVCGLTGVRFLFKASSYVHHTFRI